MRNQTVKSWEEASEVVKAAAGKLPVMWGTGYPVRYPHVVASSLDAFSGEGTGYYVTIYPDGDNGMSGMRSALAPRRKCFYVYIVA